MATPISPLAQAIGQARQLKQYGQLHQRDLCDPRVEGANASGYRQWNRDVINGVLNTVRRNQGLLAIPDAQRRPVLREGDVIVIA